ncbi:sulfotransferase family protein [Methylonatrum kenyense]|uniref:sulfotransferase family protein n=1 Tax=Methylonatrum kenyense TaxID=455253 RepID=UPI0020BFEF78|nr:sulfotransferase family protein [Methylonatrum kenyense]MCK8516991.1 sulfotransferase family protein [Methylonatrum kenyense]
MGLTTRLRVTWSPFFRRFPAKTPDMAERVNRRIAVSRKPSYIYFRVPKAANSTVIRNLRYAEEGADIDMPKEKEAFLRPSALWWWEVSRLRERFFLFTVVRDPYSRILSAYLDKVQRSNRRSKVLSGLDLTDDDAAIGFDEFCDFLERGGLDSDAHWCRQIDLIPCGPAYLHAIGRVESLAQDLPEILHRATGVRRKTLQSHSPHKTGASERMHTVYTKALAERIRTIYKADFDAFGYDPEPDWLKDVR